MNHKYELSPDQLQNVLIQYHNDEPIKNIAESFGFSINFLNPRIGENYPAFLMQKNYHVSDAPAKEKLKEVSAHKKRMELFLQTKMSEQDQYKVMNEIMCCEDYITKNYGE